jgi:hypothetical protein
MKIPPKILRKLGFQPDSAGELPARHEQAVYFRQAGSLPAETGRMPILQKNS